MRGIKDRISDAGASLVVIGNGLPHFIAGFRERSGWTGTLLTDPTLRAFNALGFKKGISSAVNARSVLRAASALARGFRQTRTQGDPWQQGGIVAIARGGDLVYEYASRFAGDHPPAEDVLAAARRASAP